MEVIRKESQELADMGIEVTIRSDVQNNRNTIARACNTKTNAHTFVWFYLGLSQPLPCQFNTSI
jgi:hypothetical protein